MATAIAEPYEVPKVKFFEALKLYIKGYVTWNARSSRAEYWWAALGISIVQYLCIGLDIAGGSGVFTGIFALVTFLPSLSIVVRRLHDTNRSGWWFWIVLIPLVGIIVLFVFTVLKSYPYEVAWNRSLPKELPQKGNKPVLEQ